MGSTLKSRTFKTLKEKRYLDRWGAAAGGRHDIHIGAAIAGTLRQVQVQFFFVFQVAFAVLQRRDADDDGARVIRTKHSLPPPAQRSVHQHFGTRLSVLALDGMRGTESDQVHLTL